MDHLTADRARDRKDEPAPVTPEVTDAPVLLRTPLAPPAVPGLVHPRPAYDEAGPSRPAVGHGAPLVDVRRHAAPALASAAPPVVRRKGGEKTPQLTSKALLAGLRRIPIVEEKLDEALAQGPTGLEHVQRALKAFDEHLALTSPTNAFVNEAIRIATVIDATAAELARSINDPTLKGRIASELIAAYRADLTAALSSTKDSPARVAQTEKALDLATVVVGDDPVMLFMTGKIKQDEAARRIREMATTAKLGPSEMLRLLRRRFEMELAAHTKAEVDAGARGADDIWEKDAGGTEKQGKGGFDLADLIGEISPTFYSAMVAAKPGAKPTARPAFGPGGLNLTDDAKTRLDGLERTVLHADLSGLTLTPTQLATERALSGPALSPKQSEHFSRLRTEEAADATNYESEGKSPREYVVGKFAGRYGLAPAAAGTLVDDVLRALATVPLTLSSKLESLFKPRSDNASLPFYGSAYKSEPSLMQEEVDLSELVGKPDRGTKAMSIGQPDADFTRSRGENYMRWRRDKDERETGYHGLGADDLPIFAAVNPNFHDTKGGNANLAEWDDKAKAWTGKTYGENYYGDVHLLLKNTVRARSTLIARGKKATPGRRIERTDLTFLLADMCRLWMYDYVDALVAQARVPGRVVLTNMDAEVHVYGGFDMATDVDAIYLQPAAFAATDGAAQRCKDFAADHGITVHDIGGMPPGYDITAKQGVAGGIDLKAALKP